MKNIKELTEKEKMEFNGGGNIFYDLGKWVGGVVGGYAVGLASSYGQMM